MIITIIIRDEGGLQCHGQWLAALQDDGCFQHVDLHRSVHKA
jgi:hypothetical protein